MLIDSLYHPLFHDTSRMFYAAKVLILVLNTKPFRVFFTKKSLIVIFPPNLRGPWYVLTII